MQFGLPARALLVLCAFLLGAGLTLPSCGTDAISGSTQSVPKSANPASTAASVGPSFEEAWTASLAALDGLTVARVHIVQTATGKTTSAAVPSEHSTFGPETEEAEELFDIPGGRARLTVHSADGQVETTLVRGREQATLSLYPLDGSSFAVLRRYFALKAPEGLPLALWAGDAVAPKEGYADLLRDESGTAVTSADGRVERLSQGGLQLSWHNVEGGMVSALSLNLDAAYLPVRIEIAAQGTPTEGDLQGMPLEYALVLTYKWDRAVTLGDSDFVLDVPADARDQGATYELALERPWSERADWGQYWLGQKVGEWRLTQAEHAIYYEYEEPETGPSDEFVALSYRRPGIGDPQEVIQVTVRPLRGRHWADYKDYLEDRVAQGAWVRRELTLAGRLATVYLGAADGDAEARVNSIGIILPDAVVDIGLWAPLDPQVILEALRPVE